MVPGSQQARSRAISSPLKGWTIFWGRRTAAVSFGQRASVPWRQQRALLVRLLLPVALGGRLEGYAGRRYAVEVPRTVRGHAIAHLDVAETVTRVLARCALSRNLHRDGGCHGARLLVGEHSRLGKEHADGQPDSGDVSDGEDSSVARLKACLINGNPARSVGEAALPYRQGRGVRRHAYQQVEGGVLQLEEDPPRGGVYLHRDLLPVKLYPPLLQHLGQGGTDGGARHQHRLVLRRVEGYLRPLPDSPLAQERVDEECRFIRSGRTGERRPGGGEGGGA